MARADDDPCEMMQTPSTPRSMAPPVLSGSSAVYSGSSAGMSTSLACLASSLLAMAARMASTSMRSDPSIVFRVTLPVKPSVTTTSTSSLMMSRPSTLPMKRTPAPALSRPCVSLTSGVPLVSSSPIDSRPTRGSAMP